jgi:hypothetical protein
MMMTKKWNVNIGQRREEISSDLLLMLGFLPPYADDETNTARDNESPWLTCRTSVKIAEAVAAGFSGDEAALYAIRMERERVAAQSLETARQKVAELEARAAADHRAAEVTALARVKEDHRQ